MNHTPNSTQKTNDTETASTQLTTDIASEPNSNAIAGCEVEPTYIAKKVLNHRSISVKEEVASNVALMEGMDRFRHDATRRAELIRPLISHKMLPVDAEKLLLAGGSHLSMLKKISDSAHVLLDSKILPFLQGGYSVLYQVALLAEDLGGDVERMLAALKSIDDLLTRENISAARRALKAVRSPESSPPSATEAVLNGSMGRKGRPCDEAGTVSAILLTPSRKDVAKLRMDYTADVEPACLRVKAANALVIATRAKDLTVLTDKLPCWGFNGLSHLYLLKPPTSPDLTQADVIAVCERGRSKLKRLDEWPLESNAKAVAEALLDQADGKRVHLFAKENADGWESVIGDANWAYDAENPT